MRRDEIDIAVATAPAVEACETFVDILASHALHRPNDLAYRFLHSGGGGEILTYADLDTRARGVAAKLTALGLAGERVLLLSPPGLDYIVGFFGCLYAGAIAVPVYPPRANRSIQRLSTIITECGARAALTSQRIPPLVTGGAAAAETLAGISWLLIDTIEATSGFTVVAPGRDDIAFLQYTSGSVSAPKGVIVSHANLMRNSALIRRSFGLDRQTRGVLWLPPYHDMGLIGGILQSLYFGGPLTLMSPASFLQKPLRWLKAISDTRATASGGPNFGYELCLRSITAAERDMLDLSSWRTALCGSEPIHPATLERFAAFFAPAGFRADAFYPCYGLAEATLIVSGRSHTRPFVTRDFDPARLADNAAVAAEDAASARRLVSAGTALVDGIVIVDPASSTPLVDGAIGEIWVRDASVAAGYWNRPEESRTTFGAHLADGCGPFLRTGDLGFFRDGELFVTGRIKELIVLRGRNLYPQDLEIEARQSHPALAQGPCIAFAVERDAQERLVIVHELPRTHRLLDTAAIAATVRRAIAEAFDTEVEAVLFVPPLGIPKTSSGKLERQGCRAAYLDGTLKMIAEYRKEVRSALPAQSRATATSRAMPKAAMLRTWLVERLANLLALPTGEIDPTSPFSTFGLDSLQAVGLSGELETWLNRSLPTTLLWDYPTIAALADHLGEPEAVGASNVIGPTLAEEQRTRGGAIRAIHLAERGGQDLEHLAEDELGALLAGKLAELGERTHLAAKLSQGGEETC
ncbi:AMP-binding protein [Sphingomonas sp. TDK1]|uniref:AMP-binding protein n=1 Tax=Sphingomonas sp. TDK1 TaxID=453247 RepID=UPI0007D9F406|nr:AMP-binding protein [Sphingomonas sp. TDK1]OAN67110.1 hypothetical protein A7X12_00310 [Sphingomonas sp. TDK1]